MEEQIRISFFRHYTNAKQDEKIIQLLRKEQWQGYGIYWALLEFLTPIKDHKAKCEYDAIAWDLRVDEEIIKRIVENYGLFVVKNGYFWSKSLSAQIDNINDMYQKRRAAAIKGGKRSAEVRQKLSSISTNAEPNVQPNVEPNVEQDKIREDKRRKDIRDDVSISPNVEIKTSSSSSSDDDATTRFFDNRISDSKFLKIVRNYMYKGACMPTEEATHLIDLFAPDWQTKDGRSFAGKEEDACQFWSVPRERKYIASPRLPAADCRGVDMWLDMLAQAKIFDARLLNEFRGCGFDKDKKVFWLLCSHDLAEYIEESRHVQLAPVFQSLYPKTTFEYRFGQ